LSDRGPARPRRRNVLCPDHQQLNRNTPVYGSQLFYLTSVALVAAVVIICFAVASFSSLNAKKDTFSAERWPSGPQLVDGEARSTNDAALDQAVSTISMPDEQRVQLFREFERQQLFREFESYRRRGAAERQQYKMPAITLSGW
jgi:hypothetical protein